MFIVHLWLPRSRVESRVSDSKILVAVLLKRKCLAFLPYKLRTGTDSSSGALFLQLSSFTLNSSPARFGMKL